MDEEFTILVTDRNRHVREFLRRELSSEGFRVLTAKDGGEVMSVIRGEEAPDLLILDPDLTYPDGMAILEELHKLIHPFPVIVHSFPMESQSYQEMPHVAASVEKSESTDCLKSTITTVLKFRYPERLDRHIARRVASAGAVSTE